MLARKNFKNARDYDVLVSSPELYKKYSNVRDSQSVQLNDLMPTTKSSGLNDKDIQENLLVQKILRPEGDEQVHHKNALSLIGIALDNADDAGKRRCFGFRALNGDPGYYRRGRGTGSHTAVIPISRCDSRCVSVGI